MKNVPDQIRHSSAVPGIIALSFFSGAMGLDIGLAKAGIEVLLASEIDAAARNTILLNRPDIGLVGDITDYSASEIRRYANLPSDADIDLMVGGPPCQAFSTAGKRKGFEDRRGNVFLTFLERIIELRPKYAVIENVRGLLSAPYQGEKGGALRHIVQRLREGGYGVSFNLYNAANFGAPQKRERVVIICSRDGTEAPFLVPTHSEHGDFGLPPWRTFREATQGLSEEDQEAVKFPEKRLKYYRLLKPGQNWRDLPADLQKEAMGNAYFAGGGKTGFFRRLAWDEPSPTLVTNPAMPATDLAHPEQDRPLSIQEYKRIQEFPDEWKLAGTILEKYRQIGNAVPVSLGIAIGRHITKLLRGEKPESIPGFPYSRYRNASQSGEQFLIGNNRGGVNGWIGRNAIFGKAVRVENPK